MTLLLRAVLGSQQSKWQITEISLISTVPTQAQSLSLSTSPTRIVHLLQMTYHYDPKFIFGFTLGVTHFFNLDALHF